MSDWGYDNDNNDGPVSIAIQTTILIIMLVAFAAAAVFILYNIPSPTNRTPTTVTCPECGHEYDPDDE